MRTEEFSPNVQTDGGGQPACYSTGFGGRVSLSPGVNRPGRDFNYLSSSSAEVKKHFNYTCTLLHLHDVRWDSFPFRRIPLRLKSATTTSYHCCPIRRYPHRTVFNSKLSSLVRCINFSTSCTFTKTTDQ